MEAQQGSSQECAESTVAVNNKAAGSLELELGGEALQLAPYNAYNATPAEKRLPERMVIIGEHKIHVQQAWKPDGKGGTEIGYGAVKMPEGPLL